MKMSLRLVFPLLITAALCCAQSEVASAPAGSAPAVNPPPAASADTGKDSGTPASTALAPANAVPIQGGAQNTTPGAAPAPAATTAQTPGAPVPAPDLPPVRKTGAEVKPAAGKTPAATTAAGVAKGTTKETQPYVIGALDVLAVKVWGQQNLTSMYAVAADGTISMPLIGDVTADGLTREQLKEAISKKLAECCFNNDPEVDVQVEKINSKRYFVYGGVGRAGEYPLIRPTTLMDAFSEVGGFRDFSNTKKIRIQRMLPSGQTTELKFNYKEVSKGKNMEQNILIQNGDRIFVPE
jgi:polysaccharide export outer membrane protein